MNTELASAETNRKHKSNHNEINKVHLRLPETFWSGLDGLAGDQWDNPFQVIKI